MAVIPIRIEYITDEDSIPHILPSAADQQRVEDIQSGYITLAEKDLATCAVDETLAEGDPVEHSRIKAARSNAEDRIRLAKQAIATSRVAAEHLARLRSKAEVAAVSLSLPTWDEAIEVEERFRTLAEGGDGWVVDRQKMIRALMRTHCPEALKLHPVLGAHVADILSSHIWPDRKNLDFMLASLKRS